MQHAFGMAIPEWVAEMCAPASTAVLVYDAQVGILARVRDRDGVVDRMRSVLVAARAAVVSVVYVRHVSVPASHMGVAALRSAMAWQRRQRAEEVQAAFPPGAPHAQLTDELAPQGGEPVFDKLGMSAFVGTPVEAVREAISCRTNATGPGVGDDMSVDSLGHRAAALALV